jgi:deoxyribodipyrimidine photo-lyase
VASTELPTPEELGIERRNKDAHGGERAAQERLRIFIRNAASRYDELRDRMDLEGTSRLSADLKFGTLSPRQIHHQVRKTVASGKARDAFLRQLVWREFAYSTLFDRPELVRQPFRQEFASFPWRDDVALWKAWTEGNTGYPIVDAAARQLLCEGFVHNRARMIAASFLAKHLMIHYRRGEAHYLKYLVDGDLAQNNMGWQWSAGCGCDAQPYFRVFNPMLQGKRFDPNGNYVRRWVPELAKLPNTRIHAPWEASVSQLEAAGVELGRDYPRPIVDHKAARERFLQLASGFLKAA